MKIKTEFYELLFPKYAKKTHSIIIPTKKTEISLLKTLFLNSHINFKIEKDNSLAVYERNPIIRAKLREFLNINEIKNSKILRIAQSIKKNVEFQELLS